MSLHARCPHCHEAQPIAAGTDTQAALSCRSCGVHYVPQRHLFVPSPSTLTPAKALSHDAGVTPDQGPKTWPGSPNMASPSASRNGLWSLASAGLALALLAQVTLSQRDLWASQWPVLRGPLQVACGLLGCTVQAPRSITAVSLVSSGFDQQDEGDFVLSLHMRHELDHAVATPAIELTLTDDFDRAVVRKIFWPAQLGLPQSLPPGAGLWVNQALELDPDVQPHVSGFRLELFYP